MANRNLTVTIRGDADSFGRALTMARERARELGDQSALTERQLDRMARQAERSAQRTRQATGTAIDAAGASRTIGILGLLTAGLAAVATTGPAAGVALGGLPALGFTAATGLGAAATALSGVADATSAVSDAQAEMIRVGGDAIAAQRQLAEELAGLSPHARELAQTIVGQVRPALRGIRDDVQAASLPQMREAMLQLLELQPLLSSELARTGGELGDLAVRAAELVTSDLFQDDLGQIMLSNTLSIRAFGGAGLSAVDMMRSLAVEGGPVVERLAQWLERTLALTNAQVQAARQTGELDELYREGEEVLGQLVDVMGQVLTMVLRVSDALGPLGGIVLDVVGGVAELIGQLAQANPELLQIGAGALIAYTSFLGLGKVLAGASLAVGTATAGYSRFGEVLGAIAPGALRDRMDGATGAIDRAGLAAGAATGQFTGSARAGESVGRAVQGAGRAALGAAAAFPAAGLTVVALGVAMDALSLSTKDAVEQLLRGGSAAAQAREQIDLQSGAVSRQNGVLVEHEGWTRRVNTAVNDWIGTTTGLWASQDSATEAMNRALAVMTEQERAAVAVTQAEQGYSDAVREHGINSDEAAAAGRRLGIAQDGVESSQRRAALATESHTDAMIRQRNEMLGQIDTSLAFEQAQLSVERAQAEAAQATRDHGAASVEARGAQVGYQQAITDSVRAAGEAAAAQYAGRDATFVAKMATEAQNAEILRLAAIAGETAPPALRRLIQGMDGTALGSRGARLEVDNVGMAVIRLPDGKRIPITAPGALQTIDELNRTGQVVNDIPPRKVVSVEANGRYTYSSGPNQAMATGGILSGWSPGRDVHRFVSPTGGTLDLSGGEGILRPEVTAAVGSRWLHGANAAARSGGLAGAASFVARTAPRRDGAEGVLGDGSRFADGGIWGREVIPHRAFAVGGIFDWAPDAVVAADRDVSARAGVDLARRSAESGGTVVQFARSQAGKPYVWAASGPNGYDCSGFMSALVNVARGRYPYSRIGATGTFPWAGFRPGFGPGLTIGSFRGNPGHMAGTVAGVNVESRGSDGVVVGPRARGAGAAMFTTRAHLPFDRGGDWPSHTPGINMSGQTEHVLTGPMRAGFLDLVRTVTTHRGAVLPGVRGGAGPLTAVLTGPVQIEGTVTVDGMEARMRGVIHQEQASARQATTTALLGAGVS